MADDIVFIVANKKKVNPNVSGVKYFPDCTLSVTHSFDNDVTEHPVEDGTSFSDHIQNKNKTFSVSGVYNAKSINLYAGDNISQDNRVADAYSFLTSLRDERKTFTLVSRYDVYPDCVVKSLRFPLAPTDGNTLLFEMDLVQIRKASVDQVNIVATQNVADFKKDSASRTTNEGKKPVQQISIAQGIVDSTEEGTDLLSQALRFFRGDNP